MPTLPATSVARTSRLCQPFFETEIRTGGRHVANGVPSWLHSNTAPAAAQGYGPDYGPGYGPGALPPHEILTILRSTGLDPLGQPVRRGPNYVLRAIDDTDREVSVVVNARSGDVLSVTPVQTASRMPPHGGITMGPYEPMPRGWVPTGCTGGWVGTPGR